MRRGVPGIVTALILAASTLLASVGTVTLAAVDPIASFSPTGLRAFTPDGDGQKDTFSATFELSAAARATGDILGWEGDLVATLLPSTDLPAGSQAVTWDGAGVPNGPYRVRLRATTADGATSSRELAIASVTALAYPINPGGITIFLDPGHGGIDTGATEQQPDGTLVMEKNLNLDIGLKLAAMLRAAGIHVSMSRTADTRPNASGLDRKGDGMVDVHDDFLARMDAANRIRADAFIAIHNNDIPTGGGRTEAFYCGIGCVYPPPSRSLAMHVLGATVAAFTPLQTPAWTITEGDLKIPASQRNPTDDAIHFADATYPPGRHYYYLGPFDRSFRPRAIQMPGMLMESLALNDPTELQMLDTASIRTLLANAYYDGIVAWLATRDLGVRIDPVTSPARARVGALATVRVRITNNGLAPIPAGSKVSVGTVAPVPVYDGSTSPGTTLGTRTLTAAVAPGSSVVVSVLVRPKSVGAAIWKVDAVVNDVRVSARRVPFLQFRVLVGR